MNAKIDNLLEYRPDLGIKYGLAQSVNVWSVLIWVNQRKKSLFLLIKMMEISHVIAFVYCVFSVLSVLLSSPNGTAKIMTFQTNFPDTPSVFCQCCSACSNKPRNVLKAQQCLHILRKPTYSVLNWDRGILTFCFTCLSLLKHLAKIPFWTHLVNILTRYEGTDLNLCYKVQYSTDYWLIYYELFIDF